MIKSWSVHCVRSLAAFVILTVVGTTTLYAQPDAPPHELVVVDLFEQVKPILEQRCYRCHGPDAQQGGLRLDAKAYVERGGHTGSPILGTSLEDSELYLRITSHDEGYRMPKEDEPLSEEEILFFKEWIEAGAFWPEPRPEPTNVWGWYDRHIEPLEPDLLRVRAVIFTFLVTLVFMLLIERGKALRLKRHRWTTGKAARLFVALYRVRQSHYVVVALGFFIVGLWLIYHGKLMDARKESEKLNQTIISLTAPPEVSKSSDASNGPIPFRPKNPVRLGGTFYRGNDERSPKLFNGGYYRTAILRLSLCDGNRNKLEVGDESSVRPLLIRLEIEKALKATPTLFSQRVMDSILLSRQVLGEKSSEMMDTPVKLETVEEGQRWAAYYAIGDTAPCQKENLSGVVYVYKGSLKGKKVDGKYHYGIKYDLRVDGGRLAEDSELWMGSLYHLWWPHIQLPAEGDIPLNEWFDFRPIPEITGENSDDPKLLGVEEHLPKKTEESHHK